MMQLSLSEFVLWHFKAIEHNERILAEQNRYRAEEGKSPF